MGERSTPSSTVRPKCIVEFAATSLLPDWAGMPVSRSSPREGARGAPLLGSFTGALAPGA
ncbi:hypothetical protein [Streptomyces sp. NPDC058011]|uniref:hypothetical protein n=1 Tax=Streptomyces sp. NPDC058011 TaxID=3346305 RepID=UPI0036EE1D8A